MDSEDAPYWQMIVTPLGEPWSGRARYAAAMHFFQTGQMDAGTLEIYRICSRLDDEDPKSVMRRWHVGDDWLARLERRFPDAGQAPS